MAVVYKESVVCESMELTVDEWVEDGESMAMPNEFYKPCLMFL